MQVLLACGVDPSLLSVVVGLVAVVVLDSWFVPGVCVAEIGRLATFVDGGKCLGTILLAGMSKTTCQGREQGRKKEWRWWPWSTPWCHISCPLMVLEVQ